MNKMLIIGAVILLIIVVVGAVVYFDSVHKPAGAPNISATSTLATSTVPGTTIPATTLPTTTIVAIQNVKHNFYLNSSDTKTIFASVVNSNLSVKSYGPDGIYVLTHCGPNNSTNATLCSAASFPDARIEFNGTSSGWIVQFGAYNVILQELLITNNTNSTFMYSAFLSAANASIKTLNASENGAIYSVAPNVSNYTTAIYVLKDNNFADILTGGPAYNQNDTAKIVATVSNET
jgi:hypothetical protein